MKKEKKSKKIICGYCRKQISDREKRLESTIWFNKTKKETRWLHWDCWLHFLRELVLEEQKKLIGRAMGLVKGILGNSGIKN